MRCHKEIMGRGLRWLEKSCVANPAVAIACTISGTTGVRMGEKPLLFNRPADPAAGIPSTLFERASGFRLRPTPPIVGHQSRRQSLLRRDGLADSA